MLRFASVCVCVCSLRYPACNVHAPCCHLWPARFCSNFSHYILNSTIFSMTLTGTFLIPGRTERDMIAHVYCSSRKVPVILVRRKTRIPWTMFRKILRYQISSKCIQWEPRYFIRTDRRQCEVNKSRFSQFCKSP